jgi:multiple sugar transport system permease protein
MNPKDKRNFLTGLAFVSPNVIGFLLFTAIPLVISLPMAFTNWNLAQHNSYNGQSIKFVGLANFYELFAGPLGDFNGQFVQFLINTLVLMIGIPFGIAGSLAAAMLLSRDLTGGRGWASKGMLIAGALGITLLLTICCTILALTGQGGTAMTILFCGVVATVLLGGTLMGSTWYRTLFYLPNFVAGVATMLLWKKLFNNETGPINTALAVPLNALESGVKSTGNLLPLFFWTICVGLGLLIAHLGVRRLLKDWRDGEIGTASLGVAVGFVLLPVVVGSIAAVQGGVTHWTLVLSWWPLLLFVLTIVVSVLSIAQGREFNSRTSEGFGSASMLGLLVMTILFGLIFLAKTSLQLPDWASHPRGLQPPDWLGSIAWAKPSLILMGLWGAIGSQNMLLYLAALTNVPQELYEAADIDGAKPFQRFWNITWPQLAPTTFFIVVMSIIGGLQSGMEQARVMFNPPGGPGQSATTLAYFVYNEGFGSLRLGYASAVAWTLFVMVLGITMINWKFGNKYVND